MSMHQQKSTIHTSNPWRQIEAHQEEWYDTGLFTVFATTIGIHAIRDQTPSQIMYVIPYYTSIYNMMMTRPSYINA